MINTYWHSFCRRYVPELRKIPDQYLYEPWKCPESVQKQVGCVIGKDYPHPIVDHAVVSQENRNVINNFIYNFLITHIILIDYSLIRQDVYSFFKKISVESYNLLLTQSLYSTCTHTAYHTYRTPNKYNIVII